MAIQYFSSVRPSAKHSVFCPPPSEFLGPAPSSSIDKRRLIGSSLSMLSMDSGGGKAVTSFVSPVDR